MADKSPLGNIFARASEELSKIGDRLSDQLEAALNSGAANDVRETIIESCGKATDQFDKTKEIVNEQMTAARKDINTRFDEVIKLQNVIINQFKSDKSQESTPTKKPTAKKPAAKKPATTAKKPVATAKPVVKKPAATTKKPTTRKPTTTAKKPAATAKPAVKKPAATTKKPATRKPATTAKKPAATAKPTVKKPAATTKKPATQKPATTAKPTET